MRSYLSLTKTFLKSLSMSDTEGFKKIAFRFLLLLVVVFIFLPFIFGIGVLTYSMTTSFMEVNFESVGLELLCILLSLFIFIFSFNVILNELYFNDNVSNVLSFPIKIPVIVASKFTSCFLAENVMSFFIILAGLVGYLFGIGFDWFSFILGLFGVFTLPIIPMIYTGIICLFIMYFTKFIKNKESVRQFSMFLVFIILFIFVFSISFLRQFNFDAFIEEITIGNHSFLNTFNGIFPHINLFIDMINNHSIISLILYVIVNIAFILLFLFLSNYLYLDGVIELSSKDTKIKNESTKLLNNIKKNSPVMSYIKKEFKILFRTPSFFINCLIINIIWPIFVYCIIKILNIGEFNKIGNLINSFSNNNNIIVFFLFILGISIMVPCISTISSSSFSRDGKNFYFIKYIPLELYKILYSKIFVSFIISFVGVMFYIILFSILSKLNILLFVSSFVIIILAIFLISLIGVFIDSIQPKLVWDDELNALRENYNTFVVMGISLLFILIFGLLGYYYIKNNLGFYNYYLIIVLTLFIFIIIMYLLFKIFGVRNIEDQEEL